MALQTFAVWAMDYTDDDALNRRMAVRPQHLEGCKPLSKAGIMKAGGGLVDPATFGSDKPKLIGSFVVYAAENLEAARKLAEQDIYYTANVWDKEKLIILPWSAGMPLPPFDLE